MDSAWRATESFYRLRPIGSVWLPVIGFGAILGSIVGLTAWAANGPNWAGLVAAPLLLLLLQALWFGLLGERGDYSIETKQPVPAPALGKPSGPEVESAWTDAEAKWPFDECVPSEPSGLTGWHKQHSYEGDGLLLSWEERRFTAECSVHGYRHLFAIARPPEGGV